MSTLRKEVADRAGEIADSLITEVFVDQGYLSLAGRETSFDIGTKRFGLKDIRDRKQPNFNFCRPDGHGDYAPADVLRGLVLGKKMSVGWWADPGSLSLWQTTPYVADQVALTGPETTLCVRNALALWSKDKPWWNDILQIQTVYSACLKQFQKEYADANFEIKGGDGTHQRVIEGSFLVSFIPTSWF